MFEKVKKVVEQIFEPFVNGPKAIFNIFNLRFIDGKSVNRDEVPDVANLRSDLAANLGGFHCSVVHRGKPPE